MANRLPHPEENAVVRYAPCVAVKIEYNSRLIYFSFHIYQVHFTFQFEHLVIFEILSLNVVKIV